MNLCFLFSLYLYLKKQNRKISPLVLVSYSFTSSQFLILCFYFGNCFSSISGCLWTQYITKHELGLLTLLPPPPKCWGHRAALEHLVCVVVGIGAMASARLASAVPLELPLKPCSTLLEMVIAARWKLEEWDNPRWPWCFRNQSQEVLLGRVSVCSLCESLRLVGPVPQLTEFAEGANTRWKLTRCLQSSLTCALCVSA